MNLGAEKAAYQKMVECRAGARLRAHPEVDRVPELRHLQGDKHRGQVDRWAHSRPRDKRARDNRALLEVNRVPKLRLLHGDQLHGLLGGLRPTEHLRGNRGWAGTPGQWH